MPPPADHSVDRESRARSEDHNALRIWLRLLTCTQLIERQVRSRLREQFGSTSLKAGISFQAGTGGSYSGLGA